MWPIKPVQLNIPQITQPQWHDLLTACSNFMQESRPEAPVPSHHEQRQMLVHILDLRDQVMLWLLYAEDTHWVGYCSIEHPKPDHPD